MHVMTKRTWLIVAVAGGVLSLCCLGTGVLMLAGAAADDSGGETASASASGGGRLEGT